MNNRADRLKKAQKQRKQPPLLEAEPITGEVEEQPKEYVVKYKHISPIGRPTEYDPKMCQDAVAFGKLGYSKTAIAAKLGISRQTLYSWVKQHPEFLDAMEKAVEESQIYWEDTLRLTARGLLEKANATATIFALKSQFQQDWKEIRTTELVGANGGPVQLQAIVLDPEDMDPEEAETMERLLITYERKLQEAEDE